MEPKHVEDDHVRPAAGIPEAATAGDEVLSRGVTRRLEWSRLLALGVLAVAACQFGLHVFAFLVLPREDWHDGLAFLGVLLGAPVAFGYGVLVSAMAWDVSPRTLGRVLTSAGWYVLGLAVAFFVLVCVILDFRSAMLWLALLPLFSVFGIVALPLTVFLYTGYAAWKFLTLVAVGGLSVGPMLLLIWLARRRVPRAS